MSTNYADLLIKHNYEKGVRSFKIVVEIRKLTAYNYFNIITK